MSDRDKLLHILIDLHNTFATTIPLANPMIGALNGCRNCGAIVYEHQPLCRECHRKTAAMLMTFLCTPTSQTLNFPSDRETVEEQEAKLGPIPPAKGNVTPLGPLSDDLPALGHDPAGEPIMPERHFGSTKPQ